MGILWSKCVDIGKLLLADEIVPNVTLDVRPPHGTRDAQTVEYSIYTDAVPKSRRVHAGERFNLYRLNAASTGWFHVGGNF